MNNLRHSGIFKKTLHIMYIKASHQSHKPSADTKILINCPHCRNNGTFDSVVPHDIVLSTAFIHGLRKCPNADCLGIIFFITSGKDVISFPSVKIQINREEIPEKIINIFDEAITCHANQCYMASGMMLRKTLESICEDKGATGGNLHQRLESLKKLIVIPNDLMIAMDVLKLMGNDATHIVAKDFEQIGLEEIEISIQFVQEILKAVYQFKGLLGKLNSLRKQELPAHQTAKEESQPK
jgi:hypothetical protein